MSQALQFAQRCGKAEERLVSERAFAWVAETLAARRYIGAAEAEGVGFEPTEAFASPVFKTGAINHSTTPPGAGLWARAILPRQQRF